MGLSLDQLAGSIDGAYAVGDCNVVDLTHDSRQVNAGWLFCALRGERDGHDFALHAVAAGASGLVVDHVLDLPVPQLVVPSVRQAIGPLASAVHGHPSRLLTVVGITGTNGKTTTAHLCNAALSTESVPAGLIGTVETRTGRTNRPSMLTTPQAPDLQRMLAEMLGAGMSYAVMEVSSHGLEQRRVDGTWFSLGVFMNLGAEHLDYHGTIEQYYAAKAQLFEPSRCGRALVCLDDAWGRRLAHQIAVPVVTFGQSPDADVHVELGSSDLRGTAVSLHGAGVDADLWAPVVGECNAANIAAAYLAAVVLGSDPDVASRNIASTPPVPGRFQVIDGTQPFLVVVDYAHTADALAERLATSRRLAPGGGRLRLVVGARGGRDRTKRQDLGRAAAAADEVFLTTDSSGRESSLAIIEEVRLGTLAQTSCEVLIEPDRRLAISRAIARSQPGDVVLITGRGHESTQHEGETLILLDDREAARSALTALGYLPLPCPAGQGAS